MSSFIERLRKLTPKQLLLLAVDQQERLEAMQRAEREPIAVIGIGCRFPGDADSPDAFWDLLRQGRDATRKVPADRWDINALFDADPDAPGRMSVRSGGFLNSVSGFDAGFFGIAPREALSMDPQQRLLLEVVWEALEHAAIPAHRLAASTASVFVGTCNSEHFLRMLDRGPEAIDAYLASGNAPSVLAGRIAYYLNLQGPTMTVDTSCSSSLVALHLACRSLRNSETDLALACGVNVMCSPIASIALSKAHMLASDGRCKAFDASADGLGRGEGCGVLVLKRQADAIVAGDTILALIRGTAVNQDGRSGGLTVPNGPAQEAVIRAALADAGVSARDIDYVEAHGTGTSLGDPIEARALSRALAAGRDERKPLFIGSVKTNIGHLEGAAGIAGVIKVILSLVHERIPPHLHFRNPSPHIPWSDYRLAVTAAGRDWPRGGRSRMAGVSSFGFSGTNVHVVLQEAASTHRPAASHLPIPCCLPLSARSDAALAQLASQYAAAIEAKPDLSLHDVVHTAGAGRSHFAHRLAVIADSTQTAAAALRSFITKRPHPALQTGIAVQGQPPEVVFLFAGEGVDCPERSRQLYEAFDVFRQSIDDCERLLGPDAAGRVLTSVLWPGKDRDAASHEPSWALPALFSLQYAISRLWISLGIEPATVMGVADGEYAAACVAGVFSIEDTIRLVASQARQTHPDAVETCAKGIATRPPRIPVAWTMTGPNAPAWTAAPAPRYWRSRAAHSHSFVERLTSLHQAGYRVFLDMGPDGCLASLAAANLPTDGSLALATLRRADNDDLHDIANSIGKLYAHGLELNWEQLAPGARKISLPTYPFERRHYWYAPAQLRRQADTSAGDRDAVTATVASAVDPSAHGPDACGDGLFYEAVWEPAARAARAASSFLEPATFAPAVRDLFTALALRHDLSISDRFLPAVDRLCVDYIALALRQLGFDTTPDRQFDAEQEAARLEIAPRHLRLFRRLFGILEEDGFVRSIGAAFGIVQPLPDDDPERNCKAVLSTFGAMDAELSTLSRCARELARVLTGEKDPLDLLFPGGSFAEAYDLYTELPFARTFNATLADAVRSAIERLPGGATLRVLEIGGGTGGTTAYVLPLLPRDRTEYTFTDVSRLFLDRAARQYVEYPFVRTAILNIEHEPAEQNFQPAQFDVVIAANVLHATADLTQTLRHVRGLLAPGGLLFLLEAFEHSRWASLTFGLTDGWWRFTDTELRQNGPLIDAQAWRGLLGQGGFHAIEVVPGNPDGPLSERIHGLIVARAPSSVRHWILAGGEKLARPMEQRLTARGDSVTVANSETTDVVFPEGSNLIYLGATDLAGYGDADVRAATMCASLACERPVHWLAARVRAGTSGRAWLVTQGAQPVLDQTTDGARWQAPVWGVGRTFALEHPDIWGGLIDVPPDGTPDDLAEILLSEIDASADDEDQIAYRDGNRWVARLIQSRAPLAPRQHLRPDATYLVTGGFGGLGLLVARWMAEQGARTIALLGRNPDPGCDAVRGIEALGARVISLAGDVADDATMQCLFQRLAAEAPPLRGVVHAAVDIDTAPIERITAAQVNHMLRPKITGTLVLERMTRDLELDFTVLFSTTTALLGASGLAHYAAANCFLDATAHSARHAGRRVHTINWGTWDRMRAVSNDTQDWYRKIGLLPLSSDEALDALGRVIAANIPHAVVARIDWARYKPLVEAKRPRPYLRHIERGEIAVSASAGHSGPRPHDETVGLVERLACIPADTRIDVLEEFVRTEAAIVLGLDANEPISGGLGFFDLGMDSLMAVEFRRRLERGAGKSFPSTLTFNYPTVQALAAFLARGFGEMPPQTAAKPLPRTGLVAAEAAADLSDLSESELEARLLARLDELR